MRKLFDRRFLLFGQADSYNLISAVGRFFCRRPSMLNYSVICLGRTNRISLWYIMTYSSNSGELLFCHSFVWESPRESPTSNLLQLGLRPSDAKVAAFDSAFFSERVLQNNWRQECRQSEGAIGLETSKRNAGGRDFP
jgi:hypothetical protein